MDSPGVAPRLSARAELYGLDLLDGTRAQAAAPSLQAVGQPLADRLFVAVGQFIPDDEGARTAARAALHPAMPPRQEDDQADDDRGSRRSGTHAIPPFPPVSENAKAHAAQMESRIEAVPWLDGVRAVAALSPVSPAAAAVRAGAALSRTSGSGLRHLLIVAAFIAVATTALLAWYKFAPDQAGLNDDAHSNRHAEGKK